MIVAMSKTFVITVALIFLFGCLSQDAVSSPYECPDMSWLSAMSSDDLAKEGMEGLEDEYRSRTLSKEWGKGSDSGLSSFCLGRSLLHAGEDELAEKFLSKSLGVNSEIPGVHLERAVARLELSDCEGALADIASERKVGVSFPGLPLIAAKANLSCENFGTALQEFRLFEDQSSRGYLATEDIVLEARILGALGRYSDSVDSYYRALERYTAMHQCAEEAVCINPFASNIVNELISVQCRAGNDQEAVALYREFLNYRKPSVDWPTCVPVEKRGEMFGDG
jgi:tetratricopeptide (TPR) repeat protein